MAKASSGKYIDSNNKEYISELKKYLYGIVSKPVAAQEKSKFVNYDDSEIELPKKDNQKVYSIDDQIDVQNPMQVSGMNSVLFVLLSLIYALV